MEILETIRPKTRHNSFCDAELIIKGGNAIAIRRKRKARALSPGDRVRVVAPAGPFDSKDLQWSLGWLYRRGYETKTDSSIHRKKGYLAGEDARRMREFVNAWKDPKTKAIFSARGGYGTTRLFEAMQRQGKVSAFLKLIKRSGTEKVFMGLSDLTVPLNWISKETGLVTVHGPMMAGKSFRELSEKKRSTLFNLFEEGGRQELLAGRSFSILFSGNASGRLWGGNMTMLQTTFGTFLEPDLRGGILFLEEVHDPEYKIDRLFSHFSMYGVFKKIRGLILGDFLGPRGKPHSKKFLAGLVKRYVSSHQIPVLSGIAAGHRLNQVWLPIGGSCKIDRRGRRLILDSFVKNK